MPVAHREITKKHIKRIAEKAAENSGVGGYALTEFSWEAILIPVVDKKPVKQTKYPMIKFFAVSEDYTKEYDVYEWYGLEVMETIPAGDYVIVTIPTQDFLDGYSLIPVSCTFQRQEYNETVNYTVVEGIYKDSDVAPLDYGWKFSKTREFLDMHYITTETKEDNFDSLIYAGNFTDIRRASEDIQAGRYYFNYDKYYDDNRGLFLEDIF